MLRVRFYTNADDPRPINWPIKHPYWITGHTEDHTVIVAYADNKEYIYENWPEAEQLDILSEESKYQFTDRFPQPEWFQSARIIDLLFHKNLSASTLLRGKIAVFRLLRVTDETGVSGTGVVAYGTTYPNGKTILAWAVDGKPQSIAIYDTINDMYDVHVGAHPNKTFLQFTSIIDPELEITEWEPAYVAKHV